MPLLLKGTEIKPGINGAMPIPTFLRVAIPSPVHSNFDYLAPAECNPATLAPGMRVRVPFGKTKTIGILVEVVAHSAVDNSRLRAALEILDEQPLLSADLLQLAQWASGYYHYPLGGVFANMLPALLRRGKAPEASNAHRTLRRWRITPQGATITPDSLARAPRQAALMRLLHAHPEGLNSAQFIQHPGDWQSTLRALINKGWVGTEKAGDMENSPQPREQCLTLNPAQQEAVTAACNALGNFQAFLLDGVTGSGKTEVYLQIIEQTLARGLQALVLVPEIGLTPQLIERFQRRFNLPLAVLHSGMSDRERLSAWVMARGGQASIIIGTRSAVFTPLKNPGVIIIDEEHDTSFKQQDGFRYSARDVAVMRAHQANIPVILGSATPSLESLHNVNSGRYHSLKLPERAGSALHPSIETLDVRHQPMDDNLSQPLLTLMARHLAQDNQVLLFLNRRGYAPTLLCHDCGWVAECRRCDAHLTLHQGTRLLQCHHCGAQRALDKYCPACKSADLRALGYGTERIEHALKNKFPGALITRIDRDSTRLKGALQTLLDGVHSGASQILLGTQMLAKGHHFPDVTLVGILDTDQGLFSADFRASERMAQLILQVAGRAGRAEKPGQVVLQTHHPDHPLLQLLLTQGYHRFADAALAERREVGLPPYSSLALLRAEASHRDHPQQFLNQAREAAQAFIQPLNGAGVELLGPVPAPMEKRAGHYRAHLLIQATRRSDLHQLLDAWLPGLKKIPGQGKVRWALDVDPTEMV